MLAKMGIESRFEGGLRVTDEKTVEIVEMVLAGSINKEIVAMINAAGEWAIGLCGKDGNMVYAEKAHKTMTDPDSAISSACSISALSANRWRSTARCSICSPSQR
jgi:acetylglutamate kinase